MILLLSFFVTSMFLAFMIECLGYFIFGENDFYKYFHSIANNIGIFRIFSYGASAIVAMDFSIRLMIYICMKNKLGLNLSIARKVIDHNTLRKFYKLERNQR